MGQSTATRAEGAPDLVITGAVILDHWGIVKADIGVRDGRIVGDRQGRQPRHDGRRRPGARDRPVDGDHGRQRPDRHRRRRRLPRPPDLPAARSTRRSAPASPRSSAAAPVRPRAPRRRRSRPARGTWRGCCEALDHWPRQRRPARQGQHRLATEAMREQLRAGALGLQAARGLGHHAGGDRRLPARRRRVRACRSRIHTDTLNEAGYVESTLAAIAGRSIHTYHTEGAGGGHAPDIITVASHPNVLPSSTNPTRPHTVNTRRRAPRHVDGVPPPQPAVPEDLAFAESRIRPSTIAAEDILHDLGAISMIGSDSQAMGRIGEVVIRTWQTAHVMKRAARHAARRRRRRQPAGPAATSPSTRSARRSPTACRREVGSVEVGKLADLVLWDPAFFGVRPHVVLKGGMVAWATMGDANASIPTPQPQLPRPMFGAAPASRRGRRWRGSPQAALDDGLPERLACAGRSCRSATPGRSAKADMPLNDAPPDIADRPRHVRRARSTASSSPSSPATRAADGAALLPLLIADGRGPAAAADGRFPAGGHAYSAGVEAAARR